MVGYYYQGNRLFHRGRIVVPVSLFMDVVEHIHRFQHAGVEKTIELFSRRYTVALSETDIRKNISNMKKKLYYLWSCYGTIRKEE